MEFKLFRYRINDAILKQLQDIIPSLRASVTGYLDPGLASQLDHCSLFLVCESDGDQKSENYSGPIAIVAINQRMACEYYSQIKHKGIVSVIGELENNCSKIKVEPIV